MSIVTQLRGKLEEMTLVRDEMNAKITALEEVIALYGAIEETGHPARLDKKTRAVGRKVRDGKGRSKNGHKLMPLRFWPQAVKEALEQFPGASTTQLWEVIQKKYDLPAFRKESGMQAVYTYRKKLEAGGPSGD